MELLLSILLATLVDAKNLNDVDPAVRQQATESLEQRGIVAVPVCWAVSLSDSPEQSIRAKSIVQKTFNELKSSVTTPEEKYIQHEWAGWIKESDLYDHDDGERDGIDGME